MEKLSYAKGKASTAKQICLGSLLGLELNLYCVMISSFCRHPCQLDLSQRHHVTPPQSYSLCTQVQRFIRNVNNIKWQPHPKYKANSARMSHIVVSGTRFHSDHWGQVAR